MFVLRSAFWLSAAFIVMAPSAGMDIGQSSRAAGEQLIDHGKQAIVSQAEAQACQTVECRVGRTLVASALSAPVIKSQSSEVPVTAQAADMAPIPPQRPDWAY